MTKKPHQPRQQRIKPGFQRVRGAVTELGEPLKMQRIPTIPDFEPCVGAPEAFVFKNLVTLGSEYKEQKLDRQHPSDHQPVVLRQPANGAYQSPADCRSCYLGFAHVRKKRTLRLFHPLPDLYLSCHSLNDYRINPPAGPGFPLAPPLEPSNSFSIHDPPHRPLYTQIRG